MSRSAPRGYGRYPLDRTLLGTQPAGFEDPASERARDRFQDLQAPDGYESSQAFQAAASGGAFDPRKVGEPVFVGSPPVQYAVTYQAVEPTLTHTKTFMDFDGSVVNSVSVGTDYVFGATINGVVPAIVQSGNIPASWRFPDPTPPVETWGYDSETGEWWLNEWTAFHEVRVQFGAKVSLQNMRGILVWQQETSPSVWADIDRSPELDADSTGSPFGVNWTLASPTAVVAAGAHQRLVVRRTDMLGASNVTFERVSITATAWLI